MIFSEEKRMKFNAVIDGGKLRAALRAIDAIADTALFQVSAKGISASVLDPAAQVLALMRRRSGFLQSRYQLFRLAQFSERQI